MRNRKVAHIFATERLLISKPRATWKRDLLFYQFKKAKEINGTPNATRGNATNNNKYIYRDLTDSETSKTEDVDEVENFGAVERPSTAERIGSDELGAIIRAKRWA